jgi:diamine N-acetyltransferase
MKRNIEPFGNGVVLLRLIEEKDLQATLAWRNHDEARIWFKSSNLITYDQHHSWFQHYREKDDDFLFIVEIDGSLVGQASVYSIDWQSHTAEVGRFLASMNGVGKGYMDMACSMLVKFCKDQLGLESLFLEVFETNQRAIKLYRRNGFTENAHYDGLIRMVRSLT